MKKAYLIQSDGKPCGIYTNLKAVWERIEEKPYLPHYSTVAGHLSNYFPVDLGTVTIDGNRLENVRIIRFNTNMIRSPRI